MKPLLDSANWSVRILDLPKRRVDSSARSLGDGFVVFDAKTATSYPRPFLLMDDAETAIALELDKNHEVLASGGRWLIGHAPGRSQSGKACAWRVADDGSIARRPMWQEAWGASSPGGVCDDVFVGTTHLRVRDNWQRHGVVWPEGPDSEPVFPQHSDDVNKMTATDGKAIAGVRSETQETHADRAIFWADMNAPRIELHPPGFHGSCVNAVGDGIQAGYVTKISDIVFPAKSAALWRGDPNSFESLAPDGSVESEVVACGSGFQAGNALYADDDGQQHSRAVAWAGSAAIALDLHALLGDEATESSVRAVSVSAKRVRILGDRWTGPRTESKTQRAVLWEAALP